MDIQYQWTIPSYKNSIKLKGHTIRKSIIKKDKGYYKKNCVSKYQKNKINRKIFTLLTVHFSLQLSVIEYTI